MLYSGGKDSNFVVYSLLSKGYDPILITIIPKSEESMLFHHPNIEYVDVQAECMDLPLIKMRVDTYDIEEEMQALSSILSIARDKGITRVYSGGISSRFQSERFEHICNRLGLEYSAPLWRIDQIAYMYRLVDLGFRFILDAVSADGLDYRWLGRIIDRDAIDGVIRLSKLHGFNPAFEGGEAETFVIDAPHFKERLNIDNGEVIWDGVRGVYRISSIDRERKIF